MHDGKASGTVPATNQKGASLVEYALLVALISCVGITALFALGDRVEASFTYVSHHIAATENCHPGTDCF